MNLVCCPIFWNNIETWSAKLVQPLLSVTQVLAQKRAAEVSVEVKRGSPGPLQYPHCQSTQLVVSLQ